MKYNVFIVTRTMGKTYTAKNVSLSRAEQAVNDIRQYYEDNPDEQADLCLFNWEEV